MNKWYLASAVVGVAAMAAVVWAEPEGPRGPAQEFRREARGGAPGGMDGGNVRALVLRAILQHPEFAREAGIKEEQVAALKEAAFAHRKAMVSLRSEAELARIDAEKLREDPKADEAALMKAIDAAGLKETAIRKAEVGFERKAKSIIGDDACEKLRERVQARMRRAREDGPGPEGAMRRPPDGGDRPPMQGEEREMRRPRAPRGDEPPPR